MLDRFMTGLAYAVLVGMSAFMLYATAAMLFTLGQNSIRNEYATCRLYSSVIECDKTHKMLGDK
jgi:hypothetical protein